MTALESILAQYCGASQTEREKGTYFEELIRIYFRHEASYADLYCKYGYSPPGPRKSACRNLEFLEMTQVSIFAKTAGTEEYHALQCKCFATDYRVRKADIDSFFTASGRKPFSRRIIVTTTNDWSENAENALASQQPACFQSRPS
jgi:predicted helicase